MKLLKGTTAREPKFWLEACSALPQPRWFWLHLINFVIVGIAILAMVEYSMYNFIRESRTLVASYIRERQHML